MDWNGNLRPPFVSPRPENSLSFLYNNNYDHYPGTGMKYPVVALPSHAAVTGVIPDKNASLFGCYNLAEKKKRLTSEQFESLESSFQEEVKLDPDRKVKLAREVGLQPRQVAVWFQNRRARWKAKQLERLYDALKLELDAVSREKQRLQEEVLTLKAKLKEQPTKNQVSTGYTEISGDETVESASVGNKISSGNPEGTSGHHQMAEGGYVFSIDNYNPVVMPPYWATLLPSYP